MAKLRLEDKYTPECCTDENPCHQKTTYRSVLDKGTAELMIAFATAIKKKGINMVHITKEMEAPRSEEHILETAKITGRVPSTHTRSATKAGMHGLLEMVKLKGYRGNWRMTSKGQMFMQGHSIPMVAIIDKLTDSRKSYFMPEKYYITLQELLEEPFRWDGGDFEIPPSGDIVGDPLK